MAVAVGVGIPSSVMWVVRIGSIEVVLDTSIEVVLDTSNNIEVLVVLLIIINDDTVTAVLLYLSSSKLNTSNTDTLYTPLGNVLIQSLAVVATCNFIILWYDAPLPVWLIGWNAA